MNEVPSAEAELYPASHKGRVIQVNSDTDRLEPYRTCWRRDYARLVHSAAFRRLQGKTQLFPGKESDFFRNRLTHSIEVAQIAKSIAIKINYTHPYFLKNPIDTDLVELAALAHDLGHPPFGHNGEMALDECMKDHGGFEGNAQTLRILAKLEKRQTKGDPEIAVAVDNGQDNRAGLNLTFRSLAAILKYDNQIPTRRAPSDPVKKGYYYTEADLVRQIKRSLGVTGTLRTIECSIMDTADDIAYSTYDLEDSFKAGFLTPASMLAMNDAVNERVVGEVSKRIKAKFPSADEFTETDLYSTLEILFTDVFGEGAEVLSEYAQGEWDNERPTLPVALITTSSVRVSNTMSQSGYYRSKLTSELVGNLIRDVTVVFNKRTPMLSEVTLSLDVTKQMEVLKNFAFQALIMSPMLKVAEYRGKDIVRQIFRTIRDDDGYLLMPSDFQALYAELQNPSEKMRVICDFIAGMTDRYAVQFYGRLFGANPETIFSPI